MYLDMDYIAYNNNFTVYNPKIKLFFGLILLIIAIISPSPLIPILIGISIFFILIFLAKIKIKDYLKFITIPLAFAVLTFIFMALFFGKGKVIYDFGFLYLVIMDDSLNLAITVFCRVFGAFSSMIFISFTTPLPEILNELRIFKIPLIFIDIAMLMYRSIFILIEETENMYNTQDTRLGFNGLKNSYRSFGYIASSLFIKSLEKGERFQISLDSRCYTGEIPVFKRENK